MFLLIAVGSCGTPAPVPTPPPVKFRTVAVVTNVSAVGGTFYVDEVGGGQTCVLVAGYCGVSVHDAPLLTSTYITVGVVDFDAYRADVVLPAGDVQIWLGPGCGMPDPKQCVNLPLLAANLKPLPRLVTAGAFFATADGARWTWIGASDFDLYRQYLQNAQSITPVLQQRAALGFNVLRVFGSFNGALGSFLPVSSGELYYTQLPRFADALAREGLYLEFTVFADTSAWTPVPPTPDAQVTHFRRISDALAPKTNVFIEAVNEADQTINYTSGLQALVMPSATNSSHGSNGSQAYPVAPFWHFVGFHTNGAFEWQRKGHECMSITPKPCVVDETTRPDQDGSLAHYHDAAAVDALLAAGGTFHS